MIHIGDAEVACNTTVVHNHGMARADPQMKLRLSAHLKGRLEAEAARNARSLNAEVLTRLEASLDGEKDSQVPDFVTRELVEAILGTREKVDQLVDGLGKRIELSTKKQPK